MMLENFIPKAGASTVALNPVAVGSRVAFSGDGYQGCDVLIYNASNQDVAVNFGTSTVTAVLPIVGTPGNMVVPSGAWMIVNVSALVTNAAAICAADSSGNIYFTPGNGS